MRQGEGSSNAFEALDCPSCLRRGRKVLVRAGRLWPQPLIFDGHLFIAVAQEKPEAAGRQGAIHHPGGPARRPEQLDAAAEAELDQGEPTKSRSRE